MWAGPETLPQPIAILSSNFLEPYLTLSHLRLQQHAHLLHLAIFGDAEFGIGDSICCKFEIVQLAPCFCAEQAYVDEKVFAGDVLEG